MALILQGSITSATPFSCLGADFFSVIGEALQPDALIVRRTGTEVRTLIVDAKDRVRIDASELSAEASKYLWGIRRAVGATPLDRPDRVPTVEAVVLVAPCGGAQSSHLNLGKALTLAAGPYGNPASTPRRQDLNSRVVDSWLGLLEAVASHLTPSVPCGATCHWPH